MAAMEDVQRLLVAVIILVVFIALLRQLFAKPECEDLAQKTLSSLANGINEAAYLPASEKEPDISEQNKYVAVPVRLCQSSNLWTTQTLAWGGAWPDWTIMYEKFPEGNFFWSESNVWSGGVGQLLIFATVMRVIPYGAKKLVIAKYGDKFSLTRIIVNRIKGAIKFPRKALIGLRKLLNRIGAKGEAGSFRARFARAFNILDKTSYKDGDGAIARLFKKIDPEETGRLGKPGRIREWFRTRWNAAGVAAEVAGKENYEVAQKELLRLKNTEGFFDVNGKYVPNVKNRETLLQMNYIIETLPESLQGPARRQLNIPSYYWGSLKQWLKSTKIYRVGSFMRNFPVDLGKDLVGYQEGHTLKADARRAWREFLAGKKALEPQEVKTLFREVFDDATDRPQKYYDVFGTENPFEVYKIMDNTKQILEQNDFIMILPEGTKLRGMSEMKDVFANGRIGISELEIEPHLKANTRWSDLPEDFQKTFTQYVKSAGFEEGESVKLWEMAKNGYNNYNGMGRGATGMTGVYNQYNFYYTKGILRNGGEEAQYMVDAIRGNYQLRPILRNTGIVGGYVYPRGKRFIMYDAAKMGATPIPWYGAAQAREQADNMVKNINTDTSNSLILEKKGISAESIVQLSSDVANAGGVRIWRKNPELADRTPVGVQSTLFAANIPENPTYYTVSPCFAIAKIWKGSDHIYVSMTGDAPDGSKCKVGDEQCAFRSYCYADNDRIWGKGWESGANNLWGEMAASWGAYAATWGLCQAVPGMQGNPVCKVAATLVGQGIIVGIASNHALGDSSCGDYWSFFQYEKAGDICDMLSMIGGGKGMKPSTSPLGASKLKKLGTAAKNC